MTEPIFSYPWTFKNFTPDEVTCKCGCGLMPEERLMHGLQEVRDYWKVPIIPTSVARCEEWNKKVGGATNSYHVHGIAADIAMYRGNARDFISLVTMDWFGFYGIGISLKHRVGFIHIDMREESKQAMWSY